MIRRFFRWCWAKRWRRWTLIAIPPAFLILNIGMVEATSQSGFCKSCHIMEPYYASWKHGAHKDVACVKCHINPGVTNLVAAKLNGLGQVVDDVLHRTGTKPSASVSQLACTRSGCHSVENLNTRKIDTGKFKFDHSKHIGIESMGMKLQCATCHAHIKGGPESEHFEVNTDACITCHLLTRYHNGGPPSPTMSTEVEPIYMTVREPHAADFVGPTTQGVPQPKAPPSNCTTCHNPPGQPFEYHGLMVDHTQFLSYGAACESCHRNVTSKPEPIDDAKCLACHTFGIERTLPMLEMHRVHAEGEHKVECFSCHGVTRHGKQAQVIAVGQFECKACHRDQHAIQQQTYLLAGMTPHSDTPVSPMFLAHVDCTGCHIKQEPVSVKPNSGATVAKAVPEACDRCHQPGFGEKMIPRWQSDTHALYDDIDAQIKALPDTEDAAAKKLASEARAILDMVKNDNSWGVHNPRYTQQLLERARGKVREAKDLLTGGAKPAPPAPAAEEPKTKSTP